MATSAITGTIPDRAADRHSAGQTLLLHLLPGAIILIAFAALAPLARAWNAPASLALLLAWLVAGIPLLLGILLTQARRRNRKLSLAGVVRYREPLPERTYLWLVPTLLVWTVLCSAIFLPISEALRQTVFPWWPAALQLGNFTQHMSQYS